MKQHLTILFADIANSTVLYQEKGDVKAHRMITECLGRLQSIVESEQGELLRTVGDAVLVSFSDIDSACRAAISLQRHHQASPLSIRIGYHHGEVIPDGGDVYGNAVNLAARVASFANAGEIITTQCTVDLMSPPFRQKACYLDRVDFKGIEGPMPVCRIQWSDDSDTRIVAPAEHGDHRASQQRLELTINGRHIVLDNTNPRLTIGRSSENDVIVEHESTSRHHAVIELKSAKVVLKDISTNGTYVNRPGQDPMFIRREEHVLEQSGFLGAGWDPSAGDPQKITFKLASKGAPSRSTEARLAVK